MSNRVSITSDSCALTIGAFPADPADPTMEFSTGSFKGSVDERRVAFLVVAIPTGSKLLSLRFEFTDPALAATDIFGTPTVLTDETRITPYREIATAKPEEALVGNR